MDRRRVEAVDLGIMARFSLSEDEGTSGSKRSGPIVEDEEDVCDGRRNRFNNKKKKEGGEREEEEEERGQMVVTEGTKVGEGVGGKGEEESDDGGGGDGKADSSINVRIDADILDCSICYEPLRPPIFQCQNGHVACSSCRAKLLDKCYLCFHTINYSRCLILEKVIESIRIPCSYAKYGCKRALSYADKEAHEEICSHAPCSCPATGCNFCGSKKMLSSHFMSNHIPDKIFSYDQKFQVAFHKEVPFQTLYGDDGYLFLLLNNNLSGAGYALSITCLRPNSVDWDFSYELITYQKHSGSKESFLMLKSLTTNMKEWKANSSMQVFLLVPPNFCTTSEYIVLDVCIGKTRNSAVS